jgi:hypothetical protein
MSEAPYELCFKKATYVCKKHFQLSNELELKPAQNVTYCSKSVRSGDGTIPSLKLLDSFYPPHIVKLANECLVLVSVFKKQRKLSKNNNRIAPFG